MAGLSTVMLVLAAILAAMLAGHLALSRGPGRGLALAFLLGFVVQAGLLGLQLLQPGLLPGGLRAATGSALPILLFLFFARGRPEHHPWRRRDILHGLPVLVMAVLGAWPGAGWRIDATLLAIEFAYALALLSGDRQDAASRWRRRGRYIAAGFLLAMAACDLWIAWELGRGTALGRSIGMSVGLVLLLTGLVGLFLVAWRDPEWLIRLRDAARDSPPSIEIMPGAQPGGAQDEAELLCARLDAWFLATRGYAEFGLGLDEAAQRLGVSSRQLSAAVNRIHGRGFRSLLNDYRVADAARQLGDAQLADKPIIEVMFDAGFQTKSSFNKEFAARLSVTPSEYRKQQGAR